MHRFNTTPGVFRMWLGCWTVDPDIFSQDEFRVFTLEDPTEHGEVNVPWSKWALPRESDWMLNWNWTSIKWGIWLIIKLLYFVRSPPWHLYIFLLANLLAFYLTYLLAFYLAFYLAYLLAYVLAYLLAYLLAFYLAYLLAFYLAVEVQRCPLSSEGPRLRSSAAHWARKVPGWGPAVPTALGTWRLRSSRAHSDRKPAVEVQQCPLRAEVGEEIGDELVRRKWTWKLMQTWSRRNWRRRKRRRRRRRRRRRMRRTALIKSNNPHLAGGELPIFHCH